MDTVDAKIIALVLLGAISFILGILPWKLMAVLPGSPSLRQTINSVLLCFGGGVLLSTCFTHILPEVREGFVTSGVDYDEKPIAEIVLCAGFFLIYLIEELVHLGCDSNVHHDHQSRAHRAFSVNSITCEAPRRQEEAPVSARVDVRSQYQTFDDTVEVDNKASAIRDFLTILALSLHSVFEGLAVGLEDEVADVWKLFGAVATHKFVIAFALGVELKHSKTPFPIYILYLATFAAMSSIGVGIGIGISQGDTETQAFKLAISTLQGLASGTILYVVVFEVLQRERSKKVSGMVQWIFLIIGFSVMMCIDLFAGHHHDEGDHDHDHGHDLFGLPSEFKVANGL